MPRIGESVFENCSGLTSVEIPASVTSIGDYAFKSCTALTSIEIPASVTSIGGYAFKNCSGLTSITWNAKNKVSYTDCNPFDNIRSQITEFIIGDEVTSIPAGLCKGMKKLKSVTIPTSVTSIGSDAFYGCTGLTSIEIPASVTRIDAYVFWGCSGLTSIEIPASVTRIEHEAFYGCKGLTSIEIPSSVTTIVSGAFSGCTGLNKVISHATVPPTCSYGEVWYNVNKSTCTLYVPAGTKAAYAAATGWKDFIVIEEFDPTEITTLDAETTDTDLSDSEIYTMGGQRVDALQAGANIVRMKNGKVKKIVKR